VKRNLTIIICLLLAFSLASCGGGSASRTGGQSPTVNDVLENAMKAEDGNTASEDQRQNGIDPNAHVPENSADGEALSNTEGIDVDLTALSSTMVYSQVYNMLSDPAKYMGKTIKMSGAFAVFHNEVTDVYYFACIVKDATACCANGIEFVLKGEHSYPDDYPQIGEIVTVTGVFDTYTEGEYTYCTLRNASML